MTDDMAPVTAIADFTTDGSWDIGAVPPDWSLGIKHPGNGRLATWDMIRVHFPALQSLPMFSVEARISALAGDVAQLEVSILLYEAPVGEWWKSQNGGARFTHVEVKTEASTVGPTMYRVTLMGPLSSFHAGFMRCGT